MPERAAGRPPGGMPTMSDVAAAAGVSRALVSIVFRGAEGASEETRARVFRVADQMGYRTNRTASLLARRRTKHLGVTMNVGNAFHAELVESIQEAADRAGYEIVLSTVTRSHDERRAVETLVEFRCEALILLGSGLAIDELAVLAQQLPLILIGRRAELDNVAIVRSADGHGLGLAVDHLVALGHRVIAHVDGGPGTISDDRRAGFAEAMRRARLAGRAIMVGGGGTEEDGRRAAGALLRRKSPPTAITTFNDYCALGVLDALARAGVSVPKSCSVTGYDNSLIAQFAAVDLTTVSQEPGQQAEWAVRAAIDRLEGGRQHMRESVLEPRLVVRGSSGPVPTS